MNTQQSLFALIPDNIKALLPLLLIGLLGVGVTAYGITSVLPLWRTHDKLQSDLESNRRAATQNASEQAYDPALLQRQIDSTEEDLATLAAVFLDENLVDVMLDRVYQYAEQSGVTIINLQSQQPLETEVNNAYEIQSFRLQVDGDIPRLINFVILLRETSLPSVVINNLSMTSSPDQISGSLTINILVYTSPYASGTVFDDLPEVALITPVMMTQINSEATSTQSSVIIATSTPAVTMTPSPEQIIPTATPTAPPETTQPQNIVGPGTYNDDSPAIQYVSGEWQVIADSAGGFGSNYHYSLNADASLQLQFLGTGVAIQYILFRNFGIFEVQVDGSDWGEVDGYAAEGTFGQVVYITGLSDGVHTLVVRNTDRSNPASEGNVIAIDAIHVLASTGEE